MSNIVSICPGCGVTLNSKNNLLEKDFNASSACRELYYQLSYYTLALQYEDFSHQLILDTYAGQHFLLPKQKAQLTVKEVFEITDDKKQEMIKNWCKDVWKIWKSEENEIASILQEI